MHYKVLDTNIILENADNIYTLSSDGATIVIPETVIDELDSKKSILGEIGYQARAFGRLLSKGVKQSLTNQEDLTITAIKVEDTLIEIVASEHYPDFKDTSPNIINDRKIIEIALQYSNIFKPDNVTFISNDVMCRIRAESLGLKAKDVKYVESTDIEFIRKLEISSAEFSTVHNSPIIDLDPKYVPNYYCYIFTCASTAQVKLAVIKDGTVDVIGKVTERELREQDVNPSNSGQLFLSYLIRDKTADVTLCEAKAGSGKTITALSNAMKMVKQNNSYESIVYIRNTVDDVAEKDEEIGFLAGNDEKVAVYLAPFYDSVGFVARKQLGKSKLKGQELEEKIQQRVEKIIKDYTMTPMIALGLRGRTIDNAIVIIDEAQNMSKSTMQKILTRIGKGCKVIVLGSLKQIDSKYITKYTSGLSVLLDAAKRDDHPIKLNAVSLDKVERGPITEFAEQLFARQ